MQRLSLGDGHCPLLDLQIPWRQAAATIHKKTDTDIGKKTNLRDDDDDDVVVAADQWLYGGIAAD